MKIDQLILQPAFVLHTRKYRDTSLLVDLLTKQHGRMTVVARGVRSVKSCWSGILTPFLPLLVTFRGRTDLRTLQQAEVDGLGYSLEGEVLLSGFYLNELLIKLLPLHEAYPKIYQVYQATLIALAGSQPLEVGLRLFEKCLIANLGYGLELGRTTTDEVLSPHEEYRFEFGSGFSKARSDHVENFLGKSILALHVGSLTSIDELRDAKRLLRIVLTRLLGNKQLKSRELFLYPNG